MRHRRLVADETASAVAQHRLFFVEDECHGAVPVRSVSDEALYERHSPMCNCTSEDAPPELGFTRVRQYHCPSRQQPTWMRRPGIHTPDHGYGFRARVFDAPRNDGCRGRQPQAPGKSRIRLATMPSMTSLVPPSIELALVRSQARGRAPPLERSLSHSSASAPPADIRIS